MTPQSTGSASCVHFPLPCLSLENPGKKKRRFQKHLIVALCGVAVAALSPHPSSAQQVAYYDFNVPAAAPAPELSFNCSAILGGPAANGIFLCLNYPAGGSNGLGLISDFYPPPIDPNASVDGNSGSTNYALQLTQNAGSQDSSAWFSIPQNVANGFNLWYAVKINPAISLQANAFTADGMAFVIQNASGGLTDTIANCQAQSGSGYSAVGGGGGCLGYGGIDNSIALEMDTFYDNQFDPYDNVAYFPYPAYVDNHMALQGCGPGNPNSPAHLSTPNCLITLNGAGALASNPPSSATGTPVILADGNPHQVVIIYNGPSDSPANYLYVYLDPAFNPGTHTPVAGSTPLFSGPFDITQHINLNNGTAYIGFTAGTGGDYEQHEVMGFAFTPHGVTNVCPAGHTTPAPCNVTLSKTFTFPADTTIGSIQVLTKGAPNLDFTLAPGGTCTVGAAYTAGQACTVNYTFAPTAPGQRYGAIEIFDNSSNLQGTLYLQGIGTGPLVNFLPGTQSAYGGSFNNPFAVALDGYGNVLVGNNGQIQKIVASGGSTSVSTLVNLSYNVSGMAVDGAGNIFTADPNNNAVWEILAAGGYTVTKELGSGFNQPGAVAVDGSGNVFVSDNGNNAVKEILAAGGYTTVNTLGSGFNQPLGIAVDGSGNVFVSDSGVVKEILAASGYTTVNNLGTGIYDPIGVAVDGNGNVFFTTWLNNAVEEIVAAGGYTNFRIVGPGFYNDYPWGLAADDRGNVFIADRTNNRIVELDFADPPALSFQTPTAVGTADMFDGPHVVTVENVGNATLNEIAPGLTAPTDFTQVPAYSTVPDCTAPFSLAPAVNCSLGIEFAPQTLGALSESFVLNDNSLNAAAAAQSISVSGTGVVVSNYLLAVTGSGTGNGAIISSPTGIQNCNILGGVVASGTCSASFIGGTTVSLEEIPSPGSTFTGWSGACEGTSQFCTVFVNSDTSVTASFALPATNTLSVTEVGTGSGTVSDDQQINCSRANGIVAGTCAANYPSGNLVTLSAHATGTSIFAGWGGACASSGANPTCNLTVNSALNATASFVAQGPTQSGALKPITAGVVYGQGGSFTSNTANNGGVSATSLFNSQGMVVDSNGNLYLSDGNNNRVLFYPAGSTTATRVYGQGGSFTSGDANHGGLSADSLTNPQGLALDSSGNLYVADQGNNRVLFYPIGSTTAALVYGQGSSFTTGDANHGGLSANSLAGPFGLAVDSSGNLYVGDYQNNRVLFYPSGSTTATQVYGQAGSFTTNSVNNGGLSATSLNQPTGVALDSSGDLYVADIYNNRVLFYPYGSTTATQVYGQPGFSTNSPDNGGISANSLNNPMYPAVDSAGNLYVVDRSNNRVLFYPFGSTTATRVYGQSNDFTGSSANNGGISANSFSQPWAVALDPSGKLYISDYSNNRVLEYGSFGNVNVCPSGTTNPKPCNSTITYSYSPASATTLGATQVVTQGAIGLDFTLASGGSCTGTIAAGSSCTVNATFSPLAPGSRAGAVTLYDSTGNPVATAPLYGIGQGPAAAFGPGTQTTLASGLPGASGVAVDAAGDVFISYNAGAVKITPAGVQSPVPTTNVSAYDVAVDGAGNIFLADTSNDRVVKVAPSGVQTTVPATGLLNPTGVAVDGAGNLFITDRDNHRVVKVTPSGVQSTVPTSGVLLPYYPTVDAAGDLFFLDAGDELVLKITPGGIQSTVPISGLASGNGVAVDAAGDVFVSDQIQGVVFEITPNGAQTTVPTTTFNVPSGLAVDAAGDLFIAVNGQGQAFKVNRSQLPSLSFALTDVGHTSTDSPQAVSVQNVGNQPLTGTAALSPNANFTQSGGTCTSFSLAPGDSCSQNFSFTPQSTGYFTATASFSDNTLNLSPFVVLQQVNMTGIGGLNGVAVTAAVPNVVGFTQPVAASTLTGAGLVTGSVSTASSSIVPSGSVIASNPPAGTQVSLGSAVKLLISSGPGQPPAPNPFTLLNNYFVTGDYAAAGVTLRSATVNNNMVTGTINIPASAGPSNAGVPAGADLVDGFLYWTTLESSATASGSNATFLGYPVSGQQIGADLPYTDTVASVSGTLRVYRANINTYFQNGANGLRTGSGAFTVSLPAGGANGVLLTEGASMVVIYRVLSTNYPLKAVVIYDGSTVPPSATTQNVQGFYDAAGGGNAKGNVTTIFADSTGWNTASSVPALGQPDHYNAQLNAGAAYGAVILSTALNNPDNDGILGAWKAGPPATDFHGGQPGYYDVKTGGWVDLPGARAGQKDLFVQLDYMCGALLSNGACDPAQENLFPSPDSLGNDPLAIVQKAFAQAGVTLHLQVGNAVPESTCVDSPGQPCQFPGQPGVVGWKNSLEFSKVWPRNFASCAAGGDCSPRFPYGQKDSYHYVLFGHSLAIPAWNTRYGTLASINSVAGGQTTLTTTNRGTGINACPSRITISGIISNPTLNGIYNTASCPDTSTIIIATPAGSPNWTYSFATNTPSEPVIGITSGTVTSISGYSDLGGADSAVTLGLWETAPNQDMSKRATVIAGTLFHEIGHTLGLSHGGLYYTPGSYVPNFEANCKPNYQSSMNYLFQLDGVGPASAVAFSNQTLTMLTQSQLSQVTSLVNTEPGFAGNPATFPTSTWYSPNAPSLTASAATLHCDGTPLGGDIGYRVNGPIAPAITPPWANGQNIAFDGQPYSTLRGFNDVSNIDLRQVGATGGQLASLASVLSFGSSYTPLNIAPGGSVSVGAGGTVTLGAGGSITVPGGNVTVPTGGNINTRSTITFGTGGNVTLGAAGTITPGSNGIIGLPSGGNVTLGSGGTITLLGGGGTVTLGAGGNVTLGAGGTITLPGAGGTVTIPFTGGSYNVPAGGTVTLGAGGNITLGAGGNVTLGAGGTVTLGGGGNVTLGGGGNITLGGGGTITLGGGGNVTLGAGGNVTLGAGGTVTLGAGGNITLGGGGNVTLGAGGTVTLGAGGNVTLGAGGNITLSSSGTITLGGGGNVTLGAGGNVTLGAGGGQINGVQEPAGGPYPVGAGGTVTLGAGGNVTLGAGGNVTLGAGGNITLGGGGTITLGGGGNVTLGGGGNVTLGAGGNITLGAGGNITLGGGGNVTLGGGGAATTELDYDTANSIVRPPPSATYTLGAGTVLVSWTPPAFGVVQTYTISRSVIVPPSTTPGPATVIGTVSGVGGNPPLTTFIDHGPIPPGTLIYTIATTLVPDQGTGTQRQSEPSPPAVVTVDQTIVLAPLQSSYLLPASVTVSATAESAGSPNNQLVSFAATGSCSVGASSLDTSTGISSASVTLNSVGSCTITASQPGDATNPPQTGTAYNAAPPVSATFAIVDQSSTTTPQIINFPQLPNIRYGSTFTLNAIDNSGIPINYTVTAPCTLSGTTTGTGTCTITATANAGTVNNITYSAASTSQSFTVYPAILNVTAGNLTTPYGQIPSLTNDFTITGFLTGDSPTSVVTGAPSLSTTATTTSAPAIYPITVSAGTLSATNYTFAPVPGTLTIQQATAAISIGNIPTNPVYGGSFTPTYSYSGTGTPTESTTSTTTSVCTVSGGTVSFVGVGTCSLTASATATTNYSAATGTPQSFLVGQATATISISNLPSNAVYNGSFTPTYSYSGTGTPTESTTSTTTSVCMVSGGSVNFVGAGTCTLTAHATASTNYSPATGNPQSFLVGQATATISIGNIPSNPVYTGSFTPTYLYSGTGTPTESTTSTTTSVCTVSGSTVNFVNVGTCTLIAHATATTDNLAATGNPQSFTVTGPQVAVSPSSINFGTVLQGSITTKPITVTNTGTAPVTINQPFISVVQGGNSNEFVALNLCPASLSAGKSCTITISFVAGPYYTPQTATLQIMDNAPGSPQQVTLTALVLIPQTITFTTNPPSSAPYKSSFTVAATGGASGNPVIFTSSGVCSITASAPGTATYTMNSTTGTCSVIANQAGNSTYAAATQVTKTVTATLIPQTITFTTNPPPSAVYKASFTVAATASSGLAVTFTGSGACSNSGATYTMTSGTGTCSVIANQAGNSTYAAAPQVTKTVTATLASQTITFTTNPPATAAWKTSFTVAATASSGLAVTFTSSGACSNSGATYTMTSATGTCSVIASQAGNSNYAAAPQVTKSVSAAWSQVSFSPTSLAFGTIKHGNSSTLNVTLSNPGTTLLIFTGFSVTGTNAGYFTQTNNCGSSLAAGAKCTIAVKFTPATTGTFSASLQVVDNAQPGSGTQTVPLSGSGN